MIGLIMNPLIGIGDRLQFTLVPENIFKLTGEKVIDMSKDWVFDHNPYVIRDANTYPETVIDLWAVSHHFPSNGFKSHADRQIVKFLGGKKSFCRGPRLYKFEDTKMIPNRVVIHLTGKSQPTKINENVIETIRERYSDFEIIQIGGPNDMKTPFINKLGLGMWETIELIASASIYIGVNSSFLHAAAAYPRISRKIILPEDILSEFIPMHSPVHAGCWLDHNNQYFNTTEEDIGVTFSYKKI